MSPDADSAEVLRAQQDALAAWIRDPSVPPPPGVAPERLQVYRNLFRNNLAALLAGNFPVIRRLHDDAGWDALVDGFLREHGSRTPLFTAIAREFTAWLEARPAREDDAAPWLAELAHYEWVELALQISDAVPDAHDPDGDLLLAAPVVSPVAWPLAYRWPVHRIAPDFRPTAPPDAPTLLLVHREADGHVRFHVLAPLTFRLLQRLSEAPALDGDAQLRALAVEAGETDVDGFVAQGAGMLAHLRALGVILGTRR